MIKTIAIKLLTAMVFVVAAGVTVKDMPASERKEFMKWGLIVTASFLTAVASLYFIAVLF